MKIVAKTLPMMGPIILLVGCGGGADAPVQEPSFLTPPTFSEEVQTFETGLAQTRALAPAAATGATGVYTGDTLLRVVDGTEQYVFLGNATLEANMTAGTIAGSLSDFRGGLQSADPEDLSGAITVIGKSVSTASGNFTSEMSGSLAGSTTIVAVGTSDLFGQFVNGSESGFFASGVDASGTLNGETGKTISVNVTATK